MGCAAMSEIIYCGNLLGNQVCRPLNMEIVEKFPNIRIAMIMLTLKCLLAERLIRKVSQGRSTCYVRSENSVHDG